MHLKKSNTEEKQCSVHEQYTCIANGLKQVKTKVWFFKRHLNVQTKQYGRYDRRWTCKNKDLLYYMTTADFIMQTIDSYQPSRTGRDIHFKYMLKNYRLSSVFKTLKPANLWLTVQSILILQPEQCSVFPTFNRKVSTDVTLTLLLFKGLLYLDYRAVINDCLHYTLICRLFS